MYLSLWVGEGDDDENSIQIQRNTNCFILMVALGDYYFRIECNFKYQNLPD